MIEKTGIVVGVTYFVLSPKKAKYSLGGGGGGASQQQQQPTSAAPPHASILRNQLVIDEDVLTLYRGVYSKEKARCHNKQTVKIKQDKTRGQ